METGAAAVLRRVREKAALLRAGDVRHTALRPALVLGGGGMEGIFSIGVLHALAGAGLTEAFEAVVGISAGAANGAYFLSGQTGIAREVYRDHLTNDAFIKLSRRSRIVDIDYLIGILRSVRPLDVAALRTAKPAFCVAVTTLEGESELIDVKQAPDPFVALKASMAMPILYNGTTEFEGRLFVDGGAADPLPLAHIMEQFQPTDILVISNESPSFFGRLRTTLIELALAPWYLREFSPEFRSEFRKRNLRFYQAIKTIADGHAPQGVHAGLVACPSLLKRFVTKDRSRIDRLFYHGVREMERLITRPSRS